MSDRDKLSDLINQAATQAQRQAAARPASGRRPIPLHLAFGIMLAGLIGYAALKLTAALAPPSQQDVAHDLEGVVDRAHELVDGIRNDTGTLPESLPNAALASVVQYEVRDKDYRLSAAAFGVRVTFERDGKRRTEIDR